MELSINAGSQKDENVAVILSFIGSLYGVATMVCSGGGLLLASAVDSAVQADSGIISAIPKAAILFHPISISHSPLYFADLWR